MFSKFIMKVLKNLFGNNSKINANNIVYKNNQNIVRTIDEQIKFDTYSTSEQWTGEYWIDGSKIYTITFDTTQEASVSGIVHGVSNIGDYRAFDTRNSYWIVNDDLRYALGVYESSTAFWIPYRISKTTTQCRTGSSWNSEIDVCYVTIRYTCTDR